METKTDVEMESIGNDTQTVPDNVVPVNALPANAPPNPSIDIQQSFANKSIKSYLIAIVVMLALLLVLITAILVYNVATNMPSVSTNNVSESAKEALSSDATFDRTVLEGCETGADLFEFVILLDNSCGLDTEQCDVQLAAVSNLVESIKSTDTNPYIAIVPMTDLNDKSQRSEVFIGLNDQSYQLDSEAYWKEVIDNGPCGDGGNGQFGSNPSLLYSLHLASGQFQFYGNSQLAKRKIIIWSNCDALTTNIVSESNQAICDYFNDDINTPQNNIDIHFINAPIIRNGTSSFLAQYPNQYISCLADNSSQVTVVNEFSIDGFNSKLSSALSTICEYSTSTTQNPTQSPSALPTQSPAASPTPSSISNTTSSQCSAEVEKRETDMTTRALPEKVLPGSQFLSYSFNMMTGKPPLDLLVEGNYRQILDFSFEREQVSAGSSDYLVPDQMDLPSVAGICHQQSKSSSVTSSSSLATLSRQSADHSDSTSASVSASGGGWGASVSASSGMSLSHSNSQSSSNSREAAKDGKTESSYTYSKAFLYAAQMRWERIHNLSSYKSSFKEAVANITSLSQISEFVFSNISSAVFFIYVERVGNGCCRDENGHYQHWKEYESIDKEECLNECVRDGVCTGIDYRESAEYSTCNLHAEIIADIDPYCEAMECYKKISWH
eukprot:231164_1